MLDVGPLDAFYGDSHIVQNVSLNIGDGEGVAILGRNGVGKTTLFKSIMNGGPRVLGPIRHRGEDITTLPSFARARRGLGFVPEDRRIYPHLTVAENIAMGGHACRTDRPAYSLEEISDFSHCCATCRNGAASNSVVASNSSWQLPAPSMRVPIACCWTSRRRASHP